MSHWGPWPRSSFLLPFAGLLIITRPILSFTIPIHVDRAVRLNASSVCKKGSVKFTGLQVQEKLPPPQTIDGQVNLDDDQNVASVFFLWTTLS